MKKYLIFLLLLWINPVFLFSINKKHGAPPNTKTEKTGKPYHNPPFENKYGKLPYGTDSIICSLNISSLLSTIKKFPELQDIDLSDPNKWISQYTQPHPKRACFRTSQLILKKYNIKGGELGKKIEHETYANGTSYYTNTIQVAVQLANGTIEGTGRQQEGIDYLDWQIAKGNPVIVGLDDNNRRTRYNYDNTTDHFVVITGRLTDEEGVYYRFFEVAAHSNSYEKENIGVTTENKLRLSKNKLLVREKGPNTSHKYTVVQVRKNE